MTFYLLREVARVFNKLVPPIIGLRCQKVSEAIFKTKFVVGVDNYMEKLR